jgi:hypothetical protein
MQRKEGEGGPCGGIKRGDRVPIEVAIVYVIFPQWAANMTDTA